MKKLDKMIVLVCGGRDFRDYHFVAKCLDQLHKKTPITRLRHGAAPGADTHAKIWAMKNDIPTDHYPADWNTYGNSAGPIRNAQMIVDRPDLVVAFPGGNGTAHMTKIAKEDKIKVWTPKYERR